MKSLEDERFCELFAACKNGRLPQNSEEFGKWCDWAMDSFAEAKGRTPLDARELLHLLTGEARAGRPVTRFLH
jgi:hypothetical protein